ncbi:hypothetical protein KNP414_07069 [Paenibacillus mucilaginosus KNP414]|uniref:Uncharacterized protein n=1 Tax=Paenibacillus mucilaginosus (strain KNP414) TaxID=1036673 RepID=F8FKI8_PAEMK|nr:hypothetical protein KNP414_07069 [Paenibacillus mucilaginosus KNP414]
MSHLLNENAFICYVLYYNQELQKIQSIFFLMDTTITIGA